MADGAKVLIWPLPAVIAWVLAWAAFIGLQLAGAAGGLALAIAACAGALLVPCGSTRWRKWLIGAGFPLSIIASGQGAAMPAAAWLAPVALLWLLYPLRTWRDAPVFPTPEGALAGLGGQACLPSDARVLDAGCGAGDGLMALRREWPRLRIDGWEWSWPLVLLSRLRCRSASVRHADIWAHDWSPYAAVYLFQRPESMPRAVSKAARELKPGAWLISLEFEAAALLPDARIEPVPGKPVWLYRAPFTRR